MNNTQLILKFKKQYKCEYDEEVDYFMITWEDENSEWIYKE